MKTSIAILTTSMVWLTAGWAAAQPAPQNIVPTAVVQPLIARFSQSCIVPETPGRRIIPQAAIGPALAAIFIPKAAGAAVDLVGNLLQKAGKDKKSTVQARADAYLYRVSAWNEERKGRNVEQFPNARCLHLMSFKDASDTDWGSVVKGSTRDPEAAKLVQEHLDMIGRPAPSFYMEFAVVISDDQTAFMLQPTFLKYGRGFGGRNGEAELLSAVDFSHPGVETPFASATVLLRELTVGQTYDVDALVGSWSEWMPLDKPSDAVIEAKGRPAPKDKTEDALRFDPLNVRSVMTETRDGIKLLQSLGEMLASAKEDVAKAAAASRPSEEARKAEEATRLDDRNAYLLAMEEVKIKEQELEGKTDLEKTKGEAELKKARLAANKAALKAGLTLPFGDLYADASR